MLDHLIQKLKHFVVTFRFSLLTIFIFLFSVGILSLIGFTYYRMSNNITDVSIRLINQISNHVYHEIVDVELRAVELTSKSLGQLIKKNILNLDDESQFLKYSYNFLDSEVLPIVQIVEWGDKNGNYYSQEREPDGRILTNIIHRDNGIAKQKIIYRDTKGMITKIVNTVTKFDPRIRPWYQAAMRAKKFSWTKLFVFQHISDPFLGMAAVTPVYENNGELRGVVGIGIRIDYLAGVIQKINVSQNGAIYLITNEGKLIATSHTTHKNFKSLADIHTLELPIIVKAFNYYLSTEDGDFILPFDGKHYLANFLTLPSYTSEKWIVAVIAPDTDFIGTLRKDNLIVAMLGLFILAIGIYIVLRLVNWIVKPLNKIAQETEKIKLFNLEEGQPIRSRIKEVMRIADAISSMKKGLLSFQKYVPATLVRQLIQEGEDAKIGGTKKPLAILFSDIKDFTTLSEHMNPNELMILVCEYLDALSHIIVTQNGTIDKYIGDSIMAFWGAPLDEAYPCENAAKAALACKRKSEALNAEWKRQNKPILFTRIGLHFGDAIVGNLGSTERLNYTAIGDSINIASRLEAINKLYGTQIIVSDSVYNIIKNKFVLRMVDCVVLKGKTEESYLYELMAEDITEIPFDIQSYTDLFASAFSAYQKKQWDEAVRLFNTALVVYPEDTIVPIFIQRCEFLKMNPPGESWKGAWQIFQK